MSGTNPDTIARRCLPNGLRTLIVPDPQWSRVGICLTYRVGFRSEPPGWEGLAHLVEHVMFEGSQNVPPQSYRRDIHELGGLVSGTTHQDYTDFYQVVPPELVDRVLFQEADRMRAPSFAEWGLQTQLDEVCEEVNQAGSGPYAGLPWPLLPRVLYDSHADAHDGYGSVEALRTIRPEHCATFFHRHYDPAHAVLTVVGDIDVDRVQRQIDACFGDIPRRAVPPAAGRNRCERSLQTLSRFTDPAAPATVLAVGMPLPAARTDLTAYLASMVLAELLSSRPSTPALPPLRASCGFFGPLDTDQADDMIVTTVVPPGISPEQVPRELTALLRRWAAGSLAHQDVLTASARVADEVEEAHCDVSVRVRALGRLELLFDRAELAADLPGLLTRLGCAEVSRAAGLLTSAAGAALVLGPGPTRTRPGVPTGPRAPLGPLPTVEVRASRPLPPIGVTNRFCMPAHASTRLASGAHIVVLRDTRSTLAQLRLKFPWGAPGWGAPRVAAQAVVSIRRRLSSGEAWMRGGTSLAVSSDGQTLSLTGAVLADRGVDTLMPVLDLLDPALHVPGPGSDEPGAAKAPVSSEQMAEELQRALWLGLLQEQLSVADVIQAACSTPGAVLVVVGDVDPEAVAAKAADAMGGLKRRPNASPTATPPDGVHSVPVPGLSQTVVGLSALEPTVGPLESDRYLATALFSGFHGSRLHRRAAELGEGRQTVPFVGRDVILDRARVFVRAKIAPAAVSALLDNLTSERERLLINPVDQAEVDRCARYCAAQALSATDSPSRLADTVAGACANGRPAEWLWGLPDQLRASSADAVQTAAERLLVDTTFTGVALGPVDPHVLDHHSHRQQRLRQTIAG